VVETLRLIGAILITRSAGVVSARMMGGWMMGTSAM